MHHWYLASLGFILAVVLSLAGVDRLSRRRDLGRRLGGTLTLVLLAINVAIRSYDGRGWGSLPMNFCDWALIAAAVSLLTDSSFAFDVNYFWGFSGTLQAMITPSLFGGQLWRSFLYLAGHSIIFAACIYSMLYRGRRPRKHSVLVAFVFAQFYFALASAVNYLGQQNFGFLSAKPMSTSFLSPLSENHWVYLLEFEVVAIVFFLILYLPWYIVDFVRTMAGKPSFEVGPANGGPCK